MLEQNGIWMYIFVFLLEAICQLLSAMRIIYINNSKSCAASVICFFENGFFAVAMGAVITDVASDPVKALIYCAAFSAGVYLGAKLEKLIASGRISVEIHCPCTDTKSLTENLYANNVRFAVTSCVGEGTHDLVFMKLPRRMQRRVESIVKFSVPAATISIQELDELLEFTLL